MEHDDIWVKYLQKLEQEGKSCGELIVVSRGHIFSFNSNGFICSARSDATIDHKGENDCLRLVFVPLRAG